MRCRQQIFFLTYTVSWLNSSHLPPLQKVRFVGWSLGGWVGGGGGLIRYDSAADQQSDIDAKGEGQREKGKGGGKGATVEQIRSDETPEDITYQMNPQGQESISYFTPSKL